MSNARSGSRCSSGGGSRCSSGGGSSGGGGSGDGSGNVGRASKRESVSLSPKNVIKSSNVAPLPLAVFEGTDGKPGNVLHFALCPFLDASFECIGDLSSSVVLLVVISVFELDFDEIPHFHHEFAIVEGRQKLDAAILNQ